MLSALDARTTEVNLDYRSLYLILINNITFQLQVVKEVSCSSCSYMPDISFRVCCDQRCKLLPGGFKDQDHMAGK